jgi:hypothetical protein
MPSTSKHFFTARVVGLQIPYLLRLFSGTLLIKANAV